MTPRWAESLPNMLPPSLKYLKLLLLLLLPLLRNHADATTLTRQEPANNYTHGPTARTYAHASQLRSRALTAGQHLGL